MDQDFKYTTMCIVIGKYFSGTGWVAIKNRDRNYIPEISFKKNTARGVEILYFWDDITQYCEGMNSAGVGILSASLMVLDDEKEISKRSKTPSKDGAKIKKALQYPNAKLTADQVTRIREDLSQNRFTRKEISIKLNISYATVVAIEKRRIWKHMM